MANADKELRQLDFFADTPKPVPASPSLMPFPLARRRKLVLKAAITLMGRKTQVGREKYWGRLVRDLASEPRRHGAVPDQVEAQLLAFHQAVGYEVLGRERHPMTPNGAA
ncbi:MAG: hypothetical protein EON56_02860 [Alphaproteobacteria bacterium]|nr:MAG: hypothetical protein EON56_02860 [Alphaproteobacteria bacterium]